MHDKIYFHKKTVQNKMHCFLEFKLYEQILETARFILSSRQLEYNTNEWRKTKKEEIR